MDVGFIGLGAMGRPMARNLAAAGHRVVAWNRSPAEAPDGVTILESPRRLAQEATSVFVMVSDTAAVEEVLFGPEGWTRGAQPGSVVIQCSTIGPKATEDFSRRLEAVGLHLLDAPVGGSVKPAVEGTLVVLGGGDPVLFDRYRPLFDAIASRTVVFGAAGAGSAVKLAFNGLLLATLGAAAECASWLVAREPGLDLAAFSSVIERISLAASLRLPTLVGQAPAGGFSLRLATKDLALLDAELGDAYLMPAVLEMARAGLALGLGELDVASLGATARSRAAGSPVRP
jgi:3-hydroxyisobutyrate dehydrogenase-like beta-hydroxyacid dehydrogenase